MPFGSHKHKKRILVAIAISFVLPVFVVAQDAGEEELSQAKESFSRLWHTAAETTQRRAALEQSLAEYDTRVANAKHDLEAAANQRKAIREQATQKKKLVDALAGQLLAVQDMRGFYQAAAAGQATDVKRFVRYVASKNIAMTDAGPVAPGWLGRYMMPETLGDYIQDQIATLAIMRARERFLSQVKVFVAESERTEERLHAVASDLQNELANLDEQSRMLAVTVSEKTSYIDTSWRQKQLNEAELKEIAAEAAEASATIAGMQQSLLKINEELKERKLNALKDKMKSVEEGGKDLLGKRDALQRKDIAMSGLEDAVLRAYQRTVNERNTDKKLYKRIEERERELQNLRYAIETGVMPDSSNTGTGHVMTDVEREKNIAASQELVERIALMKTGVPDDAAAAYLQAKAGAAGVDDERTRIAQELEALKPALADVMKRMSAIAAEIEAAEKESTLFSDMPPIFLWPVKGTVTAGYFDADYVKVFGVPHRAIDIAVPQGSVVRSISDGIVYTVRDGGEKGFSYVLIGHRDGYASLYGHVSSFLVRKGDVVAPGQAIALSGGLPGTHGAGPMTTGAHVHLEITKDGVHVNPLSVLPAK